MAMVTGNFGMALDSIRATKWRSLLTMLGIIVGVMSVVVIVSIGEGVKRQVSQHIAHLGPDLVTVRPGKPVTRDSKGNITGVNFTTAFVGNALSETDLRTAKETPGVATAVPLSLVTGTPAIPGRSFDKGLIFGTTEDLPDTLKEKVAYGQFFTADQSNKNVAVIGTHLAEELFQDSVPIGYTMKIRGESFTVLGVFDEFETASLLPSVDYNSAVFIPLATSKRLSNNQTNIQQILVKPKDSQSVDQFVSNLHHRLLNAHGGQDDFTILKQADNLAIANSIVNLLTALISGVAAISLIVGGIGVMNIMLVSVTERTQEIGIRKAVGATNRQILEQFIAEATVISLVGGLIGVAGSVLANFLIRIFTDLQPVLTVPIMLLAVLAAVAIGVVFGTAPALKAARKDPIQALRRV